MLDSGPAGAALKELSRWRESDRRGNGRPRDFPIELGLPPFELVRHAALPAVLLEQYDRKDAPTFFFFSNARFRGVLCLTLSVDVQFKCFVGLLPEVSHSSQLRKLRPF